MAEYYFTPAECLNAIEEWPHEPWTKEERDYLVEYFENWSTDHPNEDLVYGEEDINSFLLEILDDLNN